jgi:cytochrome d ubiquinol oxidase subunit I
LRIGGWPDEEKRETCCAIELPHGLSMLAFHEWDAEVKGLDAFPREDWAPVAVVHVAFQVMVGAGTALAGVGLLWLALWWRKRALPVQPWLLKAAVVAGPLGFLALEAGWTVTEVGRQPWVVYGIVRTAQAVTPVSGLFAPFAAVTALYLLLAGVVSMVMFRLFAASATDA